MFIFLARKIGAASKAKNAVSPKMPLGMQESWEEKRKIRLLSGLINEELCSTSNSRIRVSFGVTNRQDKVAALIICAPDEVALDGFEKRMEALANDHPVRCALDEQYPNGVPHVTLVDDSERPARHFRALTPLFTH